MVKPFSFKEDLVMSEERGRSKSASSHEGIVDKEEESKHTMRYHYRPTTVDEIEKLALSGFGKHIE